jgi:hypothetical protein
MFVFVVPRRRRLHGADRIGRRKAIDQSGLKPGVNVAIRLGGLAGIGGMTVMRRRIELLSHEILRCDINGRVAGRFLGWLAARRPRNESPVPTVELPHSLANYTGG